MILLKILSYIVQILILTSVLLIIYGNEYYYLESNLIEYSVEWIVIPLFFYFILIYISKYIDISIYTKSLLSFINLLFTYGFSTIWYKLYNSELNKSDIILQSFFYNLKRRWQKEDFFIEGNKLLEMENVSLNLEQIYNQIKPKSMCLWKENLLEIVIQHKQSLLNSVNKKTFLSTLIELFSFNSYSENTKYIILSVGFIGAVLLVVGVKDFLLFSKFEKNISFSFYSKQARNLNDTLSLNSSNDLIQYNINKNLALGIDNQYRIYNLIFDLQEQILLLSRIIKVILRGNLTNQEITDMTQELNDIWFFKSSDMTNLENNLSTVHRNNQ